MLSQEENEALTRVGPGTPMGELMRRYWMPAVLSWEVEPDGAPLRVRLLGERLIAFRDTLGAVGLFDERCPHRGASLWLGRNEEHGLRCVYHGWKYDATGQCVDMMNEPNEFDFSPKVRVSAYPTHEAGGVVWAYMGPVERQPPPPLFRWTQAPETHRHVNKTWEECNWLQALEGGLDTSHAPIMHRTLREDSPMPGMPPSSPFVRGAAPELEVDVTDYGYAYFGVRNLGDGRRYIRGYHYVLPFSQIRPGADFTGGDLIAGHLWVPMDDENCMVYNWEYSTSEPMSDPDMVAKELGTGPGDQDEHHRKYRNKDNDYLIDRQAQKTDNFTGIRGVNIQDHAGQESMGPTYDRSKEHLGPADRAIIVARRLLADGMKTVADGGDPAGTGTSFYHVRAVDRVLSDELDWREALRPEMFLGSPSS